MYDCAQRVHLKETDIGGGVRSFMAKPAGMKSDDFIAAAGGVAGRRLLARPAGVCTLAAGDYV